jgi:Fe-S oxidoreductase
LAASPPVRWLADVLLGLDRRRTPPAFVRQTFLHWWSQQSGRYEHSRAVGSPRLALFADTFTNFHEPAIPQAVVQLAAAASWSITVPPRVCCGRPLISKGFLDDARRQAEQSVRTLLPLAEQGTPIVFCEPGCYSAVRDDHPQLLRGELQTQAKRVAQACLTFEEWALQACGPLAFQANASRMLVHAHCHQKALVGTGPIMQLLAKTPAADVVDLDAGCCGMAGSFGYEREHYEVSRAVGQRKLFPAVEAAAGATVVAPGFSCRHQLAHFTGVEAVHPAILLQQLLSEK